MRRRILSPYVKDMQTSDASMFNIGRCWGTMYLYTVCMWENGAKGAIVDLYDASDELDSDGKSLFGIHHEYLSFVDCEIDLERELESSSGLTDLTKRCPLVAEGIIAHFVKVEPKDRNYPEMFKAYYDNEKALYSQDRMRRDPYSFDENLDVKFDNGVHLREERNRIKSSLHNLLPYLKESQHAQIKNVADAYIKYIKSKATKTVSSQTKDKGRRSLNSSQKDKKDYSRYSFNLNIEKRKLENLYVLLSTRDDEGKRFIDGDLQKYNDAVKYLPLSEEKIKYYNEVKPGAVNMMLFNTVFSGQETDVRIVWTGDAIELWYLIKALKKYKVNGKSLLDKSGSGPGIWQLVCYRFLNGKSRKVLDASTHEEYETSEPIEFEAEAFRHYSKKNSLRDTSILDAIINKIAPQRDKTFEEEFYEETNPDKYGIKAPAQEFNEGFRDTNHKNKY